MCLRIRYCIPIPMKANSNVLKKTKLLHSSLHLAACDMCRCNLPVDRHVQFVHLCRIGRGPLFPVADILSFVALKVKQREIVPFGSSQPI